VEGRRRRSFAQRASALTPYSGRDGASAYDKDPGKAVSSCFDRQSGEPVPAEQLKSYEEYEEALAQYYLHPEAKFHNGDYWDHGATRRRHILALATEYIGKEANRWEEQLHLRLVSGHRSSTDCLRGARTRPGGRETSCQYHGAAPAGGSRKRLPERAVSHTPRQALSQPLDAH
jgi:hypothetical protein